MYKSILSFPRITQVRPVHMACVVDTLHRGLGTGAGGWGLGVRGLKCSLRFEPSMELQLPGQEAPYYNLHKGSLRAGRSPDHFVALSSLCSNCCDLLPLYPPSLDLKFFSGFILLTKVPRTMDIVR